MADRSVTVRLRAQVRDFNRDIGTSTAAVGTLESRLRSADKEGGASIDRLSGRLRVLAEVAAVAGHAVGPLGGVAIAGVAGLASQLGFAAVAGGVLIGSLQGVGDALSAMNKAQLDPTNKNLEAAEDALKRLSPAAQEFAEAAFDIKPALVAIRDMGAEELMPGLTESLDNLEQLGPRVAGIFQTISRTVGEISADATSSLASERWADFFTFVEQEAPDALSELATTVGDLTHGMAELWEAFTPVNDGFSTWLMGVADGFDDWATGLSATEGFSEFVDYVKTTGPQVADTLGALANAMIQIVQASAPLGGPVLAGLEAVAKAIGAIADSDLGTPIFAGIAALSLLNRTLAVTASLSKVSLSGGLFAGLGTVTSGAKAGSGSLKSFGGDLAVLSRNYLTAGTASERMAAQNAKAVEGIKGTARVIGPTAGLLGGLALASSGAADGVGLTNTASMALMGTMAGPWGAAIGGGVGLLLDWKASSDQATASADNFRLSLQSMDLTSLNEGLAQLKGLQQATGDDFLGSDVISQRIRDTEKALTDLEWAEKRAGIEAKGAALQFLTQTGANVDLAKWSGKSTESIKAQADAIIKSRQAAQQTAQSFINLGEGVDDAKVSLSEWIQQVANEGDALRNFMNNAKTASKRGLRDGLINDLQDLGTAGALRMKQLANATDGEIARANHAWKRGQDAMRDYNNFKVPPKKVTADTSRAMQSFREVDQYLSSLNGKTATTYVNTVRTITGKQGAAVFGQKADGGTILGPRQPYGDKVPYLLAPGEEVISNRHGQADRHRGLLKQINSNRMAGGGTAGGKDAAEEAKQDREDAQQRREEHKQRAEDRRQRRLEAQRIRDLLASDLRDEREQANLEVRDAARRLKSAREADRPKSEIREAQLALKTARTDRTEMREQRRDDRLEKAAQKLIEAANTQLDAATAQRDATQQLRDSLYGSVSGQFTSSLTGGGLAGLNKALSKDIGGGQAMADTLRALVDAGLDTTGASAGLFQELASSDDVKTAQQLLAAGPDAISYYEQQYATRASVNSARGGFVADASFGALLTQQNAAVAVAEAAKTAAEAHASALEGQVARLELRMGDVVTAVNQQADRFGQVLNGVAATAGRSSGSSVWTRGPR